MELDPHHPRIFSLIAYSYYKCQEYKTAFSFIEPSFDHDSEESDYEERWKNLTKLCIDDELYDYAMRICEVILKYKPNNDGINYYHTLLKKIAESSEAKTTDEDL